MKRLAWTGTFTVLFLIAQFCMVSAAGADSAGASGHITVTLKNVLGKALDGRVDLIRLGEGDSLSMEVQAGHAEQTAAAGEYRIYVYIYDSGVPVLVEVKDAGVQAGKSTGIALQLLEGSSGALTIRDFDADGDLAIDRVEIASGTDPYNAAEVPGRRQLALDTRALKKAAGWYSGELHAHSRHGGGREGVKQLIKRARRAGLDFLAITDRNSVASLQDPEYHSDKLVLLPALEWGTDDRGVALVYGPRTALDAPTTVAAAQGECIRVQAQGGIFAIAHPCLPSAPWQWGLSYVNAVEAWCRSWRDMPPMTLEQLGEDLKARKDGRLLYSIAQAAARSDLAQLSANAQASYFYDLELNQGLMACAIGGSNTSSPKARMGRPVTRVFARELSAPALLEGLRMGRTYVTCDEDGPVVSFTADVLNDNKVDVGIGGVVPLDVDTRFLVAVKNAKGKKLQVLENGHPIRTVPILKKSIALSFLRHPKQYSVYRVRVIGSPKSLEQGLGDIDVYAMTSPIYAQDITQDLMWRNPKLDVDKAWIRIEGNVVPEPVLPEDMPPAMAP